MIALRASLVQSRAFQGYAVHQAPLAVVIVGYPRLSVSARTRTERVNSFSLKPANPSSKAERSDRPAK
jgi:hypothetical protein